MADRWALAVAEDGGGVDLAPLGPDGLPAGPVRIGLTAGASTPNHVVGEVVTRLLALRGRTVEELVA